MYDSSRVSRYVAFLRGINVGGHTVRMEHLRKHFEDCGFVGASTFIASGNVLFESEGSLPGELEQRIEQALKHVLGYEVATFVRTDAEVIEIAAHEPFSELPRREADSTYVVFLRAAPDATTHDRVLALANEQDLFHLRGPELYWLRRGSLLDTTVNASQFARALGGMPTTVRNANTVRRLAAKLKVG